MKKPAARSERTTPFARRVYEAVRRVPAGRVTTYGAMARAIGCGSARAVGQALRRNPWAPEVPCHRVIAADGTPGGFRGRRHGDEVRRKTALLAREGVYFQGGRLADPRQMLSGARAPGKGSRTRSRR